MKNDDIKNTTLTIDDFYNKQRNSISNNIISESVANKMCKEIDYTVNTSFEKLFGEENNLTVKGVLPSFDYSSTNFKFAVMLSYFDFVNELTKASTYRKNPFYKGRRWSKVEGDSVQKDNFYFFFNMLTDSMSASSESVPVDFFIKHFMGKAKYIEVSTADLKTALSQDIEFKDGKYYLTLPKFDKNTLSEFTEFTEFTEFVNTIISIKDGYLNKITFNSDEIIDSRKKEIEAQIFSKSKKAISVFENKLQDSEKNDLISFIKKIKKQITALKSCPELDIFKMLLLYQFYDIPYKMHFFLPDIEETKKKGQVNEINYCSLAFSTPNDYTKFTEKSCIDEWIHFINSIERISNLKENIWSNTNIRLQNDWKKIYDQNKLNYELLSSAGENIFKAICSFEKIDAQIVSRVKKFDSLFNKLLNRANGCDPDFPGDDFDLKFNPKQKFTFESRANRLDHYKSLVKNPTLENASILLSNIKDIVGLRIICKFENDVEKFHSLFFKCAIRNKDKKNESIEYVKRSDINSSYGVKVLNHKPYMIKNGDYANYDRGYYYTSNHYTINLSSERKDLIEFKEISDINFELQVRTTLSQGVSDVSHDIYYKTNLPDSLNEDLKKLAEDGDIKKHSWDLADIDKKFSILKDQYEKFIEKFKDYID